MARKWATFTSSGSEVLSVTRCLKTYNINMTFKTSSTLGKFLTKGLRKSDNRDALEKCGVYKLKCGSCSGVYVGQAGRNFKTRFKEHINDIMNERDKTGYSHHVLTTGHERASVINSLEVIEVQPKNQYINTLEKYIYKHGRTGITLNEVQYDMYNPIFELT
jgi:hypothetical protein